MTPKKRQSLMTKQNILDAAIRLFNEEPFEKVTVQRICEEANMTTGAFYYHFPGKEHILMLQYDIVDQIFTGYSDKLLSESYFDKICEYIAKYAQTAEDDGVTTVTEVYRMWLVVKEDFPFSYTQGFVGELFKLVELAIRNGELKKDIDVSELVRDIVIITRGAIYNWCQRKGSFDLEKKAVELVRGFLSSYRAD